MGVADQPLGAVVDAQCFTVDAPTGPAWNGFASIAEAVALFAQEAIVDALAERVCPAPRGGFTPLAGWVALLVFRAVVDADAQPVQRTRRRGRWCLAAVAWGVTGRPIGTLVNALTIDEATGVLRSDWLTHGAIVITAQTVGTAVDTDVLLGPARGRRL